jgi:hypothetical protein
MKKLLQLLPLLLLTGCIAWPGVDNRKHQALMYSRVPQSRPLPPSVGQKLRQPLLRLALSAPITGNYSITLTWDASTNQTVTGYKLYEGGASMTYTNVVDVGSALTYTYTNVASGTYFFAATAYAPGGLESSYSPEVGTVIPQPNVVSVAVQLLVSTSTTDPSPWKVYTNMPVIQITNPVSPLFFKSQMTISQTSTSGQVVKLNTSTLVITNQ